MELIPDVFHNKEKGVTMGNFSILNEAVIKGDVQTAVSETQKA
jgi:hypothetical protein